MRKYRFLGLAEPITNLLKPLIMNKVILLLMFAMLFVACENDVTDFSTPTPVGEEVPSAQEIALQKLAETGLNPGSIVEVNAEGEIRSVTLAIATKTLAKSNTTVLSTYVAVASDAAGLTIGSNTTQLSQLFPILSVSNRPAGNWTYVTGAEAGNLEAERLFVRPAGGSSHSDSFYEYQGIVSNPKPAYLYVGFGPDLADENSDFRQVIYIGQVWAPNKARTRVLRFQK